MISYRVIVAVFLALLSQGFVVSAIPQGGSHQHYARSEQLGSKILSRNIGPARSALGLQARSAEHVRAAPRLSSITKRNASPYDILTAIGTTISVGTVAWQGTNYYYKKNPTVKEKHKNLIKMSKEKVTAMAKAMIVKWKPEWGTRPAETDLESQISDDIWVDALDDLSSTHSFVSAPASPGH